MLYNLPVIYKNTTRFSEVKLIYMQTTCEVPNFFHFHTSETKLNKFLFTTKNQSEFFLFRSWKFWCCRIDDFIHFLLEIYVVQKKKLKTLLFVSRSLN